MRDAAQARVEAVGVATPMRFVPDPLSSPRDSTPWSPRRLAIAWLVLGVLVGGVVGYFVAR